VLAARGFTEAVTSALGPAEAHGFLSAGFSVREHLHLLAHSMHGLPVAPPTVSLRRGKRADRGPSLVVDAKAFDEFWRLDDAGFDEAMTATPSSRFRVSDDQHLIAYAITGRAGDRGFIQRLAVDPSHHGRGIGTALVADALRWLERRSVTRTVVNTQESNEAALALYQRVGFRLQPGGLAVLCATL
jgi:ribosomal protein S18 acetylase RimI-like enzyme